MFFFYYILLYIIYTKESKIKHLQDTKNAQSHTLKLERSKSGYCGHFKLVTIRDRHEALQMHFKKLKRIINEAGAGASVMNFYSQVMRARSLAKQGAFTAAKEILYNLVPMHYDEEKLLERAWCRIDELMLLNCK